jgi:hypothetical protein
MLDLHVKNNHNYLVCPNQYLSYWKLTQTDN